MRRKLLYRKVREATVAPIAISLMVIIVVALTSVVAIFVLDLVEMPEDPPTVNVLYTDVHGRWTVHFEEVSEEVSFSDFKLMARHENGELVQYDPDGDTVADRLLAVDLSELVVASGGGAQSAPLSFVDVDSDGNVSPGDILVVQSLFVPDANVLADGTRGYKRVGLPPNGIPLGSDLTIVATETTLATSNLRPGDEVHLEILHGSTVEAVRDGNADASGSFIAHVYLEPSWHQGNHKADFVVRPGAADEWTYTELFKTLSPAPPTPAEEVQYDMLLHPLGTGDEVSLVYKPTNTVVLRFKL